MSPVSSTSQISQTGGKRILIVEEALHTLKGHWFEYIKTISDACRGEGDSVSVITHAKAHPKIRTELPAIHLLSHSAWDNIYDSPNPAKRYLGVIQHNWRLYRAIDRFLQQEEKWDCILAPTILIHHLAAWAYLAHKHRKKKFGRMVLIFINGQGVYRGPECPPRFPRHPKTALFRFLLRRLAPLVESGQVSLAAETEAMAREYTDFCGVPFQLFAHPVHFPDRPDRRTSQSGKPLTFSCLGFARHEKGTDLLQEAILAIRQRHPDLRIQFLIQWLDDFSLSDGTSVTRHRKLVDDPDVQFITEALHGEEYRRILSETDAMVLPYRASSYYARVSRVAIESAIAGIPIVYTGKTWLEELVVRCGAGEKFEDENTEDLIAAILRMAENIDRHRTEAAARSRMAREFHSPRNYRAALIDDAPRAGTQPLPAGTAPIPDSPNLRSIS